MSGEEDLESLAKQKLRKDLEKDGNLEGELAKKDERIADLENVVEIEAMRQLETDKQDLLKMVPVNRREAIEKYVGDDFQKLEAVKASLILQGNFGEEDEDNEPPEQTISGKATLPDYMLHPNQRGQVRSPTPVQMYSDLYTIIRSPTSSAEEKSEAEQILDDAFNEIGKGLRSRSRNNPYSLPHGIVTHCMACGTIQEKDLGKGLPCSHCGHRFGVNKFPRNPKFHPT